MVQPPLEDEFLKREMDLFAAVKCRDFSAVAAAVADEFYEIGASGKLYSRQEMLDALKEVPVLDYVFENVKIMPIDAAHVIVTYVSIARRSHQGRSIRLVPTAVRLGSGGTADGAWFFTRRHHCLSRSRWEAELQHRCRLSRDQSSAVH